HAPPVPSYSAAVARLAQHTRMALGGLLGAGAGVLCYVLAAGKPWLAAVVHYVAQPVRQGFLRLLFILVVPLIFSAIVLGVVGMGDVRSLGRVGLKTIVYTLLLTGIAVVLGLLLVNVLRPGEGMSEAARARLQAAAADRASTVSGTASAPKT